MHELSIVTSIVELADEEAARHGATRVTTVHLKLGALSGVDSDALQFCFEAACEDTVLEGSTLIIEELPAIVFCTECRQNRTVDANDYFRCPECESLTPLLLQGKEMELTALEVI